MRRRSSGIPRCGSSSGCGMSMTRRCRIRRWSSTCACGGRRSRRSGGRGRGAWRGSGRRARGRGGGAGGGSGGRAGSMAGFVPQAKEPGAEAEVDFGEVAVDLAGQLTRCWMFAYRLSFSGKSVHRVYSSQAQEAFFEGHVTAFEVTGGVPWRHVRYDNLSPAVSKVLTGRNRTETSRWQVFRSWYGSGAFYCEPGLGGAHEKGGVEGEIGRFRRRWMVPDPQAGSLAELNARLAEADAAEDGRHIEYRPATVGEDFAAEAPRQRNPQIGRAHV